MVWVDASRLQPYDVIMVGTHRLVTEYPDDRYISEQHDASADASYVIEIRV